MDKKNEQVKMSLLQTILIVNSLGCSLIVNARDDNVALVGQMSSGDDQV